MKKIFTISAVVVAFNLISCSKEQVSVMEANCRVQAPPAWCATVRCISEGKPVCGCNGITYGSICEAECAGVTAYTMGACP